MARIDLHWQGPYSFFANETDPCLFDDPVADRGGVYLWTVRTVAGMKVCYVGKARGSSRYSTFRHRLRTELEESLSASCQQLVDLELWFAGHRKVFGNYGKYDASEHRPTLEAIRRSCRGYVAVVDADDSVLKTLEEMLIRQLTRFHGSELMPVGCSPFLSNRFRVKNLVEFDVFSHARGVLGLSGVQL